MRGVPGKRVVCFGVRGGYRIWGCGVRERGDRGMGYWGGGSWECGGGVWQISGCLGGGGGNIFFVWGSV